MYLLINGLIESQSPDLSVGWIWHKAVMQKKREKLKLFVFNTSFHLSGTTQGFQANCQVVIQSQLDFQV